MNRQTGEALSFYGFFTADGVGATGLTVTADVYRNSSKIVTAGAATESGDGLYEYAMASGLNDQDGEYICILKTAGTADVQNLVDVFVVRDVDANAVEIAGDATAPGNLANTYNGVGYVDPAAPATQAQIGNLSSGTAAVNTVATGFAKDGAEPETNDYTATTQEDGVYHIVEDDGGSTGFYYEFDVGGSGVPVSISWKGYARSNGNTYSVFAYNFITTNYEQVGSISGTVQTTLVSETFLLTNAHVGTGLELGEVRFRVTSADGIEFATDRLLCSFTQTVSALGFVGGAVWVDTVNGESGVGSNVGTITRPVDNIADAKTIATNNNLRIFEIVIASIITLGSTFDGYSFRGTLYQVDLNGQSVSGTSFVGAAIVGNDSGSNAIATLYANCVLANNTLGRHILNSCRLTGDILLAEEADYNWDQCKSGVAGGGTPSIDFGAAAETKTLSIRHYSGGMELKNFGNLGTHKCSIEGDGQVLLNANCAGGELAIRGSFKLTDNTGGAVTVLDTARYEQVQVEEAVWDAVAASHVEAGSMGELMNVDVEDAIWDAAATDHVEVGSMGELQNVDVEDAVWDAAAADHVEVGSMGELLNNIDLDAVVNRIFRDGVDLHEAAADPYSLVGLVLNAFFAGPDGTDLLVRQTDGVTEFVRQPIVTDETADPITKIG